jgi:ATP-dependent Clp protease adaptor protein ClpS
VNRLPLTSTRQAPDKHRDKHRHPLGPSEQKWEDGGVATAAPDQLEREDVEEHIVPDRPWVTIVWNDPVNLMAYVTYVFQKLFGYDRAKAHKLMLAVHHEGKAVVSSGNREEMERDVTRLHAYGLWATLQQDT